LKLLAKGEEMDQTREFAKSLMNRIKGIEANLTKAPNDLPKLPEGTIKVVKGILGSSENYLQKGHVDIAYSSIENLGIYPAIAPYLQV